MAAAPLPAARPEPDAPFTELDARRLGPVRRFFVRRPVAMDWLVAALFVVPAVAGVLATGVASPPLLAALVVGGAVLLLRRRLPLVVLAATAVLGAVVMAGTGSFQGFDLAAAFALYAVAAHERPRVAWLSLAALLAWDAAAVLLWGDAGGGQPALMVDGEPVEDTRLAEMVGGTILALLALAAGTGVRNRRLHVADLVERANALRRERDQGERLAVAAERARIAREMHDVVAHSLTVMVALADGARASLERSPERSAEALAQVAATGRGALADMRRVLGLLRDDADDGAGTISGPVPATGGWGPVEDLVAGFRAANLPVTLRVSGPPLPPGTGVDLTVHRIVQESLTNVLRHAPHAPRVEVRLEVRPRTSTGGASVVVDILDDAGATPGASTPGSGRGIIGMRERAALHGGRVEAGPTPHGWRVHAEIPLPEEAS